MAREILFKAKRIDNGEWVEGNIVISDDAEAGYEAIIIPKSKSNMFTKGGSKGDLGFENWYKVDVNTICQYTGLTDKHGNKIWENDIFKHYNRILCDEFEHFVIGVVKWDEGHCRFTNYDNEGKKHYVLNDECVYEVIGNIFDNPELLEGGV